MQSASANLVLGDRKQKDIIELFVQNLLKAIRQKYKNGGGGGQLEGLIATVSLDCLM